MSDYAAIIAMLRGRWRLRGRSHQRHMFPFYVLAGGLLFVTLSGGGGGDGVHSIAACNGKDHI